MFRFTADVKRSFRYFFNTVFYRLFGKNDDVKPMDKSYLKDGSNKKEFDLKDKHAKKYVAYLRKRYGKKRAELFSQNAS